jgi:hypothetical protein
MAKTSNPLCLRWTIRASKPNNLPIADVDDRDTQLSCLSTLNTSQSGGGKAGLIRCMFGTRH